MAEPNADAKAVAKSAAVMMFASTPANVERTASETVYPLAAIMSPKAAQKTDD
jgi:hypothetical protein